MKQQQKQISTGATGAKAEIAEPATAKTGSPWADNVNAVVLKNLAKETTEEGLIK